MTGRKHPTTRPAAGPRLAALAGLIDGDWQVCRLLADHQVLTTGLLATLLGVSPRTLQQRLATLTSLGVVERFRPHRPLGAGSAPYHYLLGEAGATALTAADGSSSEGLGWDRARLGGLAHANGRLTHQLAVNTLLAQLTHTARRQPGTRLVCWWPAHRCQARWGRLITPDAYARWRDPDGEVDFFLHHHPAADQPALRLEGYNDLAAATAITTPVLLQTGDPGQEARVREQLVGQPLLIPVATSNPACGPPTQPVWLPTSSPDGSRRYRLGALGHPAPWQPTPPTDSAAPAPDAAAWLRPPVEGLCRVEVGPDPTIRPPRRSIPSSTGQRNRIVGKRPIRPNQEITLQLPYSEVCMHLRVAGTRMRARLLANGMVQLLDAGGREFSFPITAAEAGLRHDQDGWSSVVADLLPDPQEQRAVLEAIGEPLTIADRHSWRGEVIDGPGGPLYWHPNLGYLPVPDPDQQP